MLGHLPSSPGVKNPTEKRWIGPLCLPSGVVRTPVRRWGCAARAKTGGASRLPIDRLLNQGNG